jgi:peptidoglycan hydrolase-like protein with peptidoglycan-binding domain
MTKLIIAALCGAIALSASACSQGETPPQSWSTAPQSPSAQPQQAPPAHETPIQLHRGAFAFQVQERLKRLGYYEGEVDGAYGPKTTAAIRHFQRDQGLRVTGTIDQHTDTALGLSGGDSGDPQFYPPRD